MVMLFCKVLDMSATASVVILAVLVARYFLRKAPKVISYALWAAVLFRLLCPVSLTAPVALMEIVRPEVTMTAERISSISLFSENLVREDTPLQQPETDAEPQSPENTGADAQAWAAWIWLAGVLVMGLKGVVSWFLLRRRLVGATRYRGRVYLADHIPTPFVMGVLKPKIYIPSDTPAGELPCILAHEAHHIRRRDHILKSLAYGALCLHWFNPLVWAAFLLAGQDMEMSCDEAVIRKLGPELRADYAQSLLRLATNRRVIAGMPLAFGGGDTKGRVKHMANWKKPRLWAVVASAVLCILVVAVCAVNPAGAEEVTDLEKCRLALEDIQNREDYCVTMHREHYSGALNHTSDHTYWQNGENWLEITRIPQDGFLRGYSQHGNLFVDGVYCNNVQTLWDEKENILWGKAEGSAVKPWFARFDWDAQEVQYLSTEEEGREQRITLKVEAPYFLSDFEGEYLMQFVFDSRGNLKRLENEVDTTGMYGTQRLNSRFTETIRLRRDNAERAIETEYRNYLKQQ